MARGENLLHPLLHPCEVPVARLVPRVVLLTRASPFVCADRRVDSPPHFFLKPASGSRPTRPAPRIGSLCAC